MAAEPARVGHRPSWPSCIVGALGRIIGLGSPNLLHNGARFKEGSPSSKLAMPPSDIFRYFLAKDLNLDHFFSHQRRKTVESGIYPTKASVKESSCFPIRCTLTSLYLQFGPMIEPPFQPLFDLIKLMVRSISTATAVFQGVHRPTCRKLRLKSMDQGPYPPIAPQASESMEGGCNMPRLLRLLHLRHGRPHHANRTHVASAPSTSLQTQKTCQWIMRKADALSIQAIGHRA